VPVVAEVEVVLVGDALAVRGDEVEDLADVDVVVAAAAALEVGADGVFRQAQRLAAADGEVEPRLQAVPSGLAPPPLADEGWPGHMAGPTTAGRMGCGA
jgi:hypothetical protein